MILEGTTAERDGMAHGIVVQISESRAPGVVLAAGPALVMCVLEMFTIKASSASEFASILQDILRGPT